MRTFQENLGLLSSSDGRAVLLRSTRAQTSPPVIVPTDTHLPTRVRTDWKGRRPSNLERKVLLLHRRVPPNPFHCQSVLQSDRFLCWVPKQREQRWWLRLRFCPQLPFSLPYSPLYRRPKTAESQLPPALMSTPLCESLQQPILLDTAQLVAFTLLPTGCIFSAMVAIGAIVSETPVSAPESVKLWVATAAADSSRLLVAKTAGKALVIAALLPMDSVLSVVVAIGAVVPASPDEAAGFL